MNPTTATLQYDFQIHPRDPWTDLLIDELGQLGFETFEESDAGVKAYIPKSKTAPDLKLLLKHFESSCSISFKVDEIKTENWNQQWESSFEPVIVDERCIVKADFHKVSKSYPYEITINPKMSFGTGHHQTTHLMIKTLLDLEVDGLDLLDMGSGTGVLAILASLKGAKSVTAIDTDEWAYHNCIENIRINSVKNANVEKGDAGLLAGRIFNIILANINKNVLLKDMEVYSKSLKNNAILVISGFYESDIEDLKEVAGPLGFKELNRGILQNWATLKFIKSN